MADAYRIPSADGNHRWSARAPQHRRLVRLDTAIRLGEGPVLGTVRVRDRVFGAVTWRVEAELAARAALGRGGFPCQPGEGATGKAFNSKTGETFTRFLPAISDQAMKAKCTRLHEMRIGQRTDLTLDQLAGWLNPIVAGWRMPFGVVLAASGTFAGRFVTETAIACVR